ncbi:MAG: hypothetical protein PUP46_06875 [Endozoicomonas sp. (ex Botrylloides leachii)]|nr:hypothetical protein [Endozoicomonas sp. (ex Botrylloides leachii)]
MPSNFFKLNAEYFNESKGLFSKLDINELIHPCWRLNQYKLDFIPQKINYPVFLKPEWGQNSTGVVRINSAAELTKVLKQRAKSAAPYLIQESAIGNREFEVYLISSPDSLDNFSTLSISEVLNDSEHSLPVNGVYNQATSYIDITDSFNDEQLAILWGYLKTIRTFRTARYGIKANSIKDLLTGKFKIFEINLFLPMPLVLLCKNVGFCYKALLANRFGRELAIITETIPKSQRNKSILFQKLFTRKYKALVNKRRATS